MRDVGEGFDAEVAGSSSGDRLEINAWYDGALVAESLDVASWSIDWHAGRQVQAQTTWEVADPDGSLAPWSMDDPLGPGGSLLQVTWISGTSGAEIPLAWFRIRSAEPRETWRLETDAAGGPVWVPGGGGRVVVKADDLTCIPAELDRLDAEPVVEATCLAEVVRLLDDVIPVSIDPTIVDRDVPASLVYDEGRMDAVEDHLTRVNAVYRMGGAAELEVLSAAGADPVWTVAGGDDGVLIHLDRSLSDEGVYNAATSTAEPVGGDDSTQLVGRAYIDAGPLRWGVLTPFGRRPLFHQSPATSQAGVASDAKTLLANRQANGEVELAVTCLMHPGLQLHDRVTLVPPARSGEFPIVGRVTRMLISGGAVIKKQMALGVTVSSSDLEVLAARVRGRA